MLQAWIQATRPRTLVAAVVPVAVGCSLAKAANGFTPVPALLCLGFALLVQMATNFANDYYDFKKGADGPGRLGPARTVASGLIEPRTMRRAMVLVLALAFVVGLGLLPHGGPMLLAVGIASLVCAVAYTGGPWPLAYLGLGDVFVVVFFGLVAVAFTFFVQVGEFSRDVLLAGLGVGLITNNLLVVNNFRDVEEDRLSRKKTLAVRFGRRFSLWQFWLQTLGAGACTAWVTAVDKWFWLVPLLVLGLMGRRVVSKLAKARARPEFGECLGLSAQMVPVFGVLLCGGILFP